MDFLLLERDDCLSTTLSTFFGILSIACHRVKTVEDALFYLQNYKPDCVIVDITLDDFYGASLLRECHKIYDGKMPIIVLSAVKDVEKIVGDLPIKCLLKKPFELEALEQQVLSLPKMTL